MFFYRCDALYEYLRCEPTIPNMNHTVNFIVIHFAAFFTHLSWLNKQWTKKRFLSRNAFLPAFSWAKKNLFFFFVYILPGSITTPLSSTQSNIPIMTLLSSIVLWLIWVIVQIESVLFRCILHNIQNRNVNFQTHTNRCLVDTVYCVVLIWYYSCSTSSILLLQYILYYSTIK